MILQLNAKRNFYFDKIDETGFWCLYLYRPFERLRVNEIDTNRRNPMA